MSDPDRHDGHRLSGRSLLVLGFVLVLAIAAAAVALVTRSDEKTATTATGTDGPVLITSFDGTRLDAEVTRPSGTGSHPLVVMPASYDANKSEYAQVAQSLTRAGFATVSYTQRGFDRSGGDIDVAGAATQRDARTVIDWALRNTSTDASKVGMLGVSYGAGVSLLTAAKDRRVRAVVALSTWTDLSRAFRPNDTLSGPSLSGVLDKQRADDQTKALTARLRGDPVGTGDEFDRFAESRSPASYIAELNRNRPAIMLANGWQDSLFAPTMLVDLYDELRTPKRLQLSTGDHVGPERALLAGRASRTGDAALAWLRHYLAGQQNGIQAQPPIQLEDVTTKTVQTYRTWPDPDPVDLSLASPSTSEVALTTSAPGTWTATLPVGADSGATSGPGQFVPGEQYRAPTTAVRSLSSQRALVWAAGPSTSPTRVVGTPRLSLSVASNAPDATLFAYLYDTAPNGIGTLMTLTPYTADGTTTTPKQVSFDLEPIDWTLAAGHQLTLVVDTQDGRWFQAAPAGSAITLSSGSGRPARLEVPLGG